MGLRLEGRVWEKAGLRTGEKGSGMAGRETVSWTAACFTNTGATEQVCCSGLGETLSP